MSEHVASDREIEMGDTLDRAPLERWPSRYVIAIPADCIDTLHAAATAAGVTTHELLQQWVLQRLGH